MIKIKFKNALIPKPESPCHYCEERHFKCFSSCGRYAEYKALIAEEKRKYLSKFKMRKNNNLTKEMVGESDV